MKGPPLLYKYCTAKVAKIIIQKGLLRASSPILFNDPFDSFFPPRFCNIAAAHRKLKRRFEDILSGKEILPEGSEAEAEFGPLIQLMKSAPPEIRARRASEALDKARSLVDELHDESSKKWKQWIRRLRVLCLCQSGTNPLLWSHYAGQHKGAVFEFKTTVNPFNRTEAVVYRRTPPRTYSGNDYVDAALLIKPLPPPDLRPLVKTKAPEWTYEAERRVLNEGSKDSSKYDDFKFPPLALSKILLGCRMSPCNRKAIMQLAVGDFKHVEIHQLRQSTARYGLVFDRIK